MMMVRYLPILPVFTVAILLCWLASILATLPHLTFGS